jgi:hypothetical protein
VETRSVPLSSFFTEALAPVRRKSSLPRSKPAFDLTGCEILVLPAVGKLIRVLLDEALGATLPSASQGAETPLALKVTAARASGFIKVSVAGLGGLERSTARLHLDLLRQRVERCGVAMTRSADVAGESGVSISVPDCLDGMETLIVQAADERIGLPAHRVQAVLDLGDSDHPSKCDGCWLEVDGERLQLLDLAAEPAASPPRGVVVVVRTDKGKKALKVDAVLRRQEMIVTAPEHDTVPGEDFSLCLALDGLEWMPFLWCSSRLFERQESLVSRL